MDLLCGWPRLVQAGSGDRRRRGCVGGCRIWRGSLPGSRATQLPVRGSGLGGADQHAKRWDRLACFGDQSLSLEGTFGCGVCDGVIGGRMGAILAGAPVSVSFLWADFEAGVGPLPVRAPPDFELPEVGSIVRLTGHFSDPASTSCSILTFVGEQAIEVDQMARRALLPRTVRDRRSRRHRYRSELHRSVQPLERSGEGRPHQTGRLTRRHARPRISSPSSPTHQNSSPAYRSPCGTLAGSVHSGPLSRRSPKSFSTGNKDRRSLIDRPPGAANLARPS